MRRRLRKRVVVPAFLMLAFALVTARAAWRGTVAGVEPEVSPAGRSVIESRLIQRGERKVAWCRGAFPHPIDAVWNVVTDYGRFSQIFPGIESSRATTVGPDVTRLEGTARIAGLQFPLSVEVHHHVEALRRRASWDAPSPRLSVNRGSWTLEADGPGSTRVTYEADVEVVGLPDWAVRATLLDRVDEVVAAAGREVVRRETPRP